MSVLQCGKDQATCYCVSGTINDEVRGLSTISIIKLAKQGQTKHLNDINVYYTIQLIVITIRLDNNFTEVRIS